MMDKFNKVQRQNSPSSHLLKPSLISSSLYGIGIIKQLLYTRPYTHHSKEIHKYVEFYEPGLADISKNKTPFFFLSSNSVCSVSHYEHMKTGEKRHEVWTSEARWGQGGRKDDSWEQQRPERSSSGRPCGGHCKPYKGSWWQVRPLHSSHRYRGITGLPEVTPAPQR